MTYLYICISISITIWATLQILARLYNPNRTWTVKKGNHYVSLWQRIMFINWWIMTWRVNTKTMSYTARFTDSCSYVLPTDQMDWNKLPGLQYGFTNQNSVRPGWRCDFRFMKEGSLSATCYRHEDGVTVYDEHHLTNINTQLDVKFTETLLELSYEPGCMKGYPYTKVKKSFPVLPLFPYFGGPEVAPHDITIGISNLSINGREV